MPPATLALSVGMEQVQITCSAPHPPEPDELSPIAELPVDPRAQAATCLPLPGARPLGVSCRCVSCPEHTGTELGRTWFKKLHNSKTNRYKRSGVSISAPAAPAARGSPAQGSLAYRSPACSWQRALWQCRGLDPRSASQQSPQPHSWPLAAHRLLGVALLALALIPSLLLQPHASVHTTLLQQLLVPAGRAEGCRVQSWPQSQGGGPHRQTAPSLPPVLTSLVQRCARP